MSVSKLAHILARTLWNIPKWSAVSLFFLVRETSVRKGSGQRGGRAHGLVWVPLDMIACVGPTTAIVVKDYGQI